MARSTEAFDTLAQMMQVCHRHARPLPAKREKLRNWTGVGIGLRGEKYLCPLEEVAEILKVPNVTKLPGVCSWVSGVANVRGRLLPLLDLMMYFYGVQSDQPQSRRRVIVLEFEDFYGGIVVDQVYGMQHFPVENYDENFDKVEQAIRPFVTGRYCRDQQAWTIFSPKALLDDARFMALAS